MAPVLTLGSLTVTPFGLTVFAGALAGVLLSLRRKENGPVLPLVILCALLFGHMWWVFFCPPGYTAEIGSLQAMLRIWEGGYTLYGALFGGLLGAVLGAKLSGQDLTGVLDSLAPGACAALLFCRLGEYFSGQGFGNPVENEGLWFLPVSFCTYWEEGYQEWNYAVWAWEAAAALILLVVLLVRTRKALRGEQTVLFVTALGTSQILLEQFRCDDFVRLNPFVRFSQIAALLSLIAVLVILVYRRRPGKLRVAASFTELTLATLAVVCAEFVFEKPQYTVLLYITAGLTAAGFTALLWIFRGGKSLAVSVPVLAATGALLAVHISDSWESDAWMLYCFMVLSLLAIGVTVFLNAGRRITTKA